MNSLPTQNILCVTSGTAGEGRWHRAELAKAGDAAASSRWHHHAFGLSLILCARGSVTLPTLLPFPQSLSACLVCLQPAGICVCVLSPAGATEFLYGFTLSVFGPNSAAPRFKGEDLMHLDHLPVKQGFPLGIVHQGITSGWLH